MAEQQVTQPDGSTVYYDDESGQANRQVWPDGQVTTFEYRGEQYVTTTGESHVLYTADGVRVKAWEGGDESSASFFGDLGGGRYSLTGPDGGVAEYAADGQVLLQRSPDGVVTSFEHRAGGAYVGTTGDSHVLYGADGNPVKVWKGADEGSASTYSRSGNGSYSLTDSDGSRTSFSADGRMVERVGPDGEVTTFDYRGDQYVGTTGDSHVLYGADGNPVKVWKGADEGSASTYSRSPDGSYSLTDSDGSRTSFSADGRMVERVGPDGEVTTFDYRGDQYVGTTGDSHVLYGADGNPAKVWKGNDEGSASMYSRSPDGSYSLTDPDGSRTSFSADDRMVERVGPDGEVTTFDYRGDQYVGTTGDSHVLYGADGNPAKVWKGNDEGSASMYSRSPDGSYSLTDPDGSRTSFSADDRMVQRVSPDGEVTTFDYRGDQYVGTTGDSHVLYGADGNPAKVWKGNDEGSASTYSRSPDGSYSLTDPDGSRTSFSADDRMVQRVSPDGEVTTFDYRGDQYVGTTGDSHVLYGADGSPAKVWKGDDEGSASTYSRSPDGSYSLTDPDGSRTSFSADDRMVERVGPDGEVTTFAYRGDQYVGTTGDSHVLYGEDGNPIKVWNGDDESSAAFYKNLPGGGYQLDGPDGVVEYSADDHLMRSVSKEDGTITTYEYRGDQYVGTSGNTHVLYGSDGIPIKIWQGDDESKASTYKVLDDGHYALTDPDGVVTEYNETDQAVRIEKPGEQPQTIDWLSDNSYIVTQGDGHSKYDAEGHLVQTWTGNDPSTGTHYHYPSGGGVVTQGPNGTTSYGPDGRPIVTISPDGKVTTWRVDLPALHEAANSVQKARDLIAERLKTVQRNFDTIQSMWMSPAGNTFSLLAGNFKKASDVLDEALGEGVQRMRSSYLNYVISEEQNAANIAEIAKAGHK
ncbi:hypothetical protein [Micromonospora sp. CA-111912]|uniref:hypothetical protein n=1 Tax=Micromonospora sp. CA-111912 TaxID=3239955 RepID=UPI003D8CD286